jgi:hypothetical protein
MVDLITQEIYFPRLKSHSSFIGYQILRRHCPAKDTHAHSLNLAVQPGAEEEWKPRAPQSSSCAYICLVSQVSIHFVTISDAALSGIQLLHARLKSARTVHHNRNDTALTLWNSLSVDKDRLCHVSKTTSGSSKTY